VFRSLSEEWSGGLRRQHDLIPRPSASEGEAQTLKEALDENALFVEVLQHLMGINSPPSQIVPASDGPDPEYVHPVEFSPYFLSHSSSRLDELASRLRCSLPVYSKVRRSVRTKIQTKPHEAALERIRKAKTQAKVHQLAEDKLKEYDELRAQLLQCKFDPDSIAGAQAAKVAPVLFELVH
jgi:hypothetical protein